ncbi:hypothetical protein PG996_006962 [Apiospora saccharicola]|uniref:Uncharacterized protein n=1 Tax=Apiospora saccharicola TaxID=335842 RepID=A0ABR1VC74_9PEZI
MGRRPGMSGRSISNTSEASSAPSSPGDFNGDEFLYSPKASPNPNSSSLSRRTGDMHLKTPALYPLSMDGRVFAALATLGQATRSFQSHPIP